MGLFEAKGREASRLRQRKHKLIRRYGLPEEAVGGSLSRTHRRCGKDNCHCAKGPGHPIWLLSYQADGQKQNIVIPHSLVPSLAPLVEEGRELRNAVVELLQINAQLVQLWRQEQRAKAPGSRVNKKPRRHR